MITLDLLTVGELVQELMYRSRNVAPLTALWMVTGVYGSHGEDALLHVEEEKGHVSDFVITRLPVMVAGLVQGTPLSYPDATTRPVQVGLKKPEEA